jgi:hypothetical protein
MLSTMFADETDTAAQDEGSDSSPDYAFDGFKIEFSEKVMLTPAGQELQLKAREKAA